MSSFLFARMRRRGLVEESCWGEPAGGVEMNATAGWLDQRECVVKTGSPKTGQNGVQMGVQMGSGGDRLLPVVHAGTERFDWRKYFKIQLWVLVIIATILAPIACVILWPAPTLAVSLLVIAGFLLWAYVLASEPHVSVKPGQGRA